MSVCDEPYPVDMTSPDSRSSRDEPWRPLVSIVTPVLNRASTLETCLASVTAQTYQPLEHIVIDGGSTDGTLDILRSFSGSHSMRWVTGKDAGMYDAINKGLSLAKGQVLAYVNSDDLYLPWSVEAAVEGLSKDADMVYGDLGVLRIIKGARTGFYLQFYPRFDLRYFTHTGAIGQPTVFWRREVMDAVGDFDTRYRLLGDCEYWLRVGASGKKIAHLREVLAVQVDHGATLRRTQGELLKRELKQMRDTYAEVAGRPQNPKLEALAESFRWRFAQWRILFETTRRRPKTWPMFVSFLRRHDVRVNSLRPVVLHSLPRKVRHKLWPSSPTWVDTTLLERAILDEIGAGDHGSLAQTLPQ